jgi:hypothetical protein
VGADHACGCPVLGGCAMRVGPGMSYDQSPGREFAMCVALVFASAATSEVDSVVGIHVW